jgi:hypothetical protein
MPRRPVSVTLDVENLTWLKGRAGAAPGRSVSAVVDTIISRARLEGGVGPVRSVVGTIDIGAEDPFLDRADEVVRGVFEKSLARPISMAERAPAYRSRRPSPGKRRG